MTAPVRVGALLSGLAGYIDSTGATGDSKGRWLLVGSAGLWCADCLVPGCGWTTTTTTSDTASTAALLHDLTHPHVPATGRSQTRSAS